MNKIEATITNITAEGLALVVFAEFSNGEIRSYKFDYEVEADTIKAKIQADVEALNSPVQKADDLKSLIGFVITAKDVEPVIVKPIIVK